MAAAVPVPADEAIVVAVDDAIALADPTPLDEPTEPLMAAEFAFTTLPGMP